MTLQDIIKNLYAEIIRNQNLTKNHEYLNDLIFKYGEIKNLLLLKAILLSKISLNNESELLFKRILKNYDIDVDILYNYSIVLRANKKNNEYIDCINNILKIEQNHLGALNSLGLFHYENKNYQLALDTFNKILNISPNSLNALINISNLYIHQSEFKLAESVLKKSYIFISRFFFSLLQSWKSLYEIQQY
jgi:tetratricopeptide (TPR) repeat protein